MTGGHAHIFVASPDGSAAQQITEGPEEDQQPSWSPDGFVYFHANATDRFHIWRVRPIGAFAGAAH